MTEEKFLNYDEIIGRAYVDIKRKLFAQIDSYFRKNFSYTKFSYSISREQRAELDARLKNIQDTFPKYLLRYIAERGLNEVDVYKKAHLDRRIFSKLRHEKGYMPSEQTLWAIALAMELTLDEAQELFGEAGYTLSDRVEQDVIIKFFFENRIYDIFLVNEVLDHYGFKPLN